MHSMFDGATYSGNCAFDIHSDELEQNQRRIADSCINFLSFLVFVHLRRKIKHGYSKS